MKITPLFCAACAIFMLACNNPKEQTGDKINKDTLTTAVPVTTAADTSVTGCFIQINKRDTATLQLDAKGITITGPLSYNYYEKDRNGGTLQAEITGDVLTGWYLFRSEGVMSVRQVSWKIGNGKLWPAIGEMKERNDSLVFVAPEQLSFDSVHAFVKTPCVL